jgi:mono/diheme cytochrome c family protein
MRSGGVRHALVLAAIAVAAAGAGGCNLADSGTNVVNGKEQFVQKCGSCHVLARAGTRGVVGPNLDSAFQRARADGFGESTFEGLVAAQIDSPNRRPSFDPVTRKPQPVMPADIVSGEDAEDVAAYVAEAAGKPGKDSGALAQVGGGKAEGTAEAKNGVLEIPADPDGGLFFKFAEATAPAGQLKIESVNDASIDHDISLDGNGVNERGEVVKDGGVSEIAVNLKPGEYTFYCSVDGHRKGGMEGPLTVR